jgi:hypothetical protein
MLLPPPPYRTEESVQKLLCKAQSLLGDIEYTEQYSSEINTFTTKFHATPMEVEAACVDWLQKYGVNPVQIPDYSHTTTFFVN